MISREYRGRIRVVGVTFNDRQAIISRLSYGDKIFLKREKENRYDSNAIAVCTSDGQSIGYVPRQKAGELSPLIDLGRHFETDIQEVRGRNDSHLDVVINIYERKDGKVNLSEGARYILKELRRVEGIYGDCVFGLFYQAKKEHGKMVVRYRNSFFENKMFDYEFELNPIRNVSYALEELKYVSYLDFSVNMHYMITLTELGRSIDVSEL
jgi:hypothetical protein